MIRTPVFELHLFFRTSNRDGGLVLRGFHPNTVGRGRRWRAESIQKDNPVMDIRIVIRWRPESRLDSRNRRENRPQQIWLGGVNSNRQNLARGQFENRPAVLLKGIRSDQARLQPSRRASLEAERRG